MFLVDFSYVPKIIFNLLYPHQQWLLLKNGNPFQDYYIIHMLIVVVDFSEFDGISHYLQKQNIHPDALSSVEVSGAAVTLLNGTYKYICIFKQLRRKTTNSDGVTEYTGPLDFIIVKRVNENLEEYWAIVGNDTEFYIAPGSGLIPPEKHWMSTEMSKDPTPKITYSVYFI